MNPLLYIVLNWVFTCYCHYLLSIYLLLPLSIEYLLVIATIYWVFTCYCHYMLGIYLCSCLYLESICLLLLLYLEYLPVFSTCMKRVLLRKCYCYLHKLRSIIFVKSCNHFITRNKPQLVKHCLSFVSSLVYYLNVFIFSHAHSVKKTQVKK